MPSWTGAGTASIAGLSASGAADKTDDLGFRWKK